MHDRIVRRRRRRIITTTIIWCHASIQPDCTQYPCATTSDAKPVGETDRVENRRRSGTGLRVQVETVRGDEGLRAQMDVGLEGMYI